MTRFRLQTLLLTAALCGGGPCFAAEETIPWQAEPYQLGQGLHYPRQGLTVGGYISLFYADLDNQPWRFLAQDISLLLTKRFAQRWRLFTEMEIGNALTASPDGVDADDAEFDLERLYVDYHATAAISFRAGKFLTPVGRWNLIHADPLVWTVSRPLTTAAAFSRHATGAMVHGTVILGDDELEYSVFLDDSKQLDPLQQDEAAFEDIGAVSSPKNAFARAGGAHAVYHLLDDSLDIGVSYLKMTLQDSVERKELFGLDAWWSVKGAEFSGEWVYRNSLEPGNADEHGAFLQAVLPLPGHVYLIGRHEKYKAAVLPDTMTINSAGLTYRPRATVSLKLEYRDGEHNNIASPSGWMGSLAILF